MSSPSFGGLQNLLDPVRELCERGFSPVRVAGPAAWDVPGYAAPEDFLWYESRISRGIEGLPVAIMCTYDAARLPASALLYGALETHSHTLTKAVLSESPSFISADTYLKTRLSIFAGSSRTRRDANSSQLRKAVESVADVAESDKAEEREADEKGEDP